MQGKLLVVTAFATVLSLSVSVASAQTKETTIKERNGSITVVKTDSKGTQTATDGRTVYSSGGDRDKEQVDYSTKQGGKVVSEKTTK